MSTCYTRAHLSHIQVPLSLDCVVQFLKGPHNLD